MLPVLGKLELLMNVFFGLLDLDFEILSVCSAQLLMSCRSVFFLFCKCALSATAITWWSGACVVLVWILICGALCLVALMLALVGAVLSMVGILSKDRLKKHTFYLSAICIMFLASQLLLSLSFVKAPVCYSVALNWLAVTSNTLNDTFQRFCSVVNLLSSVMLTSPPFLSGNQTYHFVICGPTFWHYAVNELGLAFK